MARRGTLIVPVLVAIALGTLLWRIGDPPALTSTDVQLQAESVTSLVADGELLAKLVADGDGYDRATKSHAAELAEELDTTATTLDSAHLPDSKRRVAVRVSQIASDSADQLTLLASKPGDRSVAKEIEHTLGQLGDQADAAAKAATS